MVKQSARGVPRQSPSPSLLSISSKEGSNLGHHERAAASRPARAVRRVPFSPRAVC